MALGVVDAKVQSCQRAFRFFVISCLAVGAFVSAFRSDGRYEAALEELTQLEKWIPELQEEFNRSDWQTKGLAKSILRELDADIKDTLGWIAVDTGAVDAVLDGEVPVEVDGRFGMIRPAVAKRLEPGAYTGPDLKRDQPLERLYAELTRPLVEVRRPLDRSLQAFARQALDACRHDGRSISAIEWMPHGTNPPKLMVRITTSRRQDPEGKGNGNHGRSRSPEPAKEFVVPVRWVPEEQFTAARMLEVRGAGLSSRIEGFLPDLKEVWLTVGKMPLSKATTELRRKMVQHGDLSIAGMTIAGSWGIFIAPFAVLIGLALILLELRAVGNTVSSLGVRLSDPAWFALRKGRAATIFTAASLGLFPLVCVELPLVRLWEIQGGYWVQAALELRWLLACQLPAVLVAVLFVLIVRARKRLLA